MKLQSVLTAGKASCPGFTTKTKNKIDFCIFDFRQPLYFATPFKFSNWAWVKKPLTLFKCKNDRGLTVIRNYLNIPEEIMDYKET